MDAVEGKAPGCELLEARVRVEHLHGEVHPDAAQRVHHVGEGVKIEHHVVLDRYPEVLFNRCHQLAGSLTEGGIDLVGAGSAGVGDEQVTGDGENRNRVLLRVEMEDHHHVAVDAVHTLGAQAVGGVLDGERAPVGGPDHQDVLGAGVSACGGGVDEALDVDPVDRVVEVEAGPGGAGHSHHDDDGQGQQDPLGLPVGTFGCPM